MRKLRGSTESFIEKAKSVHGDKYDYSKSIYVGYKKPITIICKVHGEFTQTVSDHLAGSGCKLCANKPDMNRDLFIARAREIHGDKYDYSKVVYKNMHTKVTITCPIHGDFTQEPNTHLRGQGCRLCGIKDRSKKRLKNNSYFVEKAEEIHGDRYIYDNCDYSGTHKEVEIICKKHGAFLMTPANHISNKQNCPKCSSGESKSEAYLHDFIRSKTDEYVQVKDRYICNGLETDIVVPSKLFALEYNGVYWHSYSVKKDKYFHYNKKRLAKDKGYNLLHVWEHDFMGKQPIVESIICAKLNIFSEKYYARKTQLREVSTSEEKSFLTTNHIQGYVPSSYCYGLYHGDILLALMSFGRSRFDKKRKTIELLRFCSKLNTVVVGGAGKLYKHFVNNHNLEGKIIISYEDLDYGGGNFYQHLGFKVSHVTDPGYKWVKMSGNNIQVLSRYQTQKKKLEKVLNVTIEDGDTEDTIMVSKGFNKIYNSGNICWASEF